MGDMVVFSQQLTMVYLPVAGTPNVPLAHWLASRRKLSRQVVDSNCYSASLVASCTYAYIHAEFEM